MNIATFGLLILLSSQAFATNAGDTYQQVLAEKGKPLSQVDAGTTKILNYNDASIRIQEGVVVSIRTTEQARGLVIHSIPPKTKGMPPSRMSTRESSSEWITDYQVALETAKAQHRNVFLFFTGSDWCGWCKRLDREILSTNDFTQYAQEKLILVKLDYPRHTELAPELKQQNAALAQQYQIHGYPTVIVLNSEGQGVKRLGYQPGGPSPFIQTLKSIEN